MKNRPLYNRFGFAWDGLVAAWRSEHSFRTECGLACLAVLVLLVLRPGWQWAAIIFMCGALVMGLELLNTALEYLIDHIHPAQHPAIKQAKDAAAAAVLVASFVSLCVASFMILSVVTG